MKTTYLGGCLFFLGLFGNGALARSNGIASTAFGNSGCNQCHNGGSAPAVVVGGPSSLGNAEAGTFLIRVPAVNGGGAGFNLRANQPGTFSTTQSPAGQQVRVVTGASRFSEATHAGTKADAADGLEDGTVEFEVKWTPSSNAVGPVLFTLWGLAANGNRSSRGDAGNSTTFSVGLGCQAVAVSEACAGATCGEAPDGCGGVVSCGVCSGPTSCGGGGVTGECGCAASARSGEVCNGLDDDCDGVPDNAEGLCAEGTLCLDGECRTPPSERSVPEDAGSPASEGEARRPPITLEHAPQGPQPAAGCVAGGFGAAPWAVWGLWGIARVRRRRSSLNG